MITLLLTILITVLFCLGWRIITDEGNLLYFIRKPFEKALDSYEMNKELYAKFKYSKDVKRRVLFLKFIVFISKPFVLCITCFGSLWGAAIYLTLNGISVSQIPYLIINCIAASFIQTYAWLKFEKTKNCNECN